MKPVFDLSELRATLQRGINAGYWTLDALDTPPPNYHRELTEARQSKYFSPTYSPPSPYRNLLRDHSAPEAVQPVSPRDFDVAATTRANEGQRHVDLFPQQWPSVPCVSDQPDLSRHQDARADGSDHGHQGHLGATWKSPAPNHGGDGQSALESQPAPDPDLIPW